MANDMKKKFSNSFYDTHSIDPEKGKLSDRLEVNHIPGGHTPDGYQVRERIEIYEKGNNSNYFELGKDGSLVETNGVDETGQYENEAYTMMGVDTESDQFKQFQKTIKEQGNFNEKTVKEFIENVPQISRQEQIEKLNDINERQLNQATPDVSFIDEMNELSQHGETEIAKPGRTYSGNIVDVGEDVTIQKTKTGKFVIHETENLPGIQENDEKGFSKIRYDSGGKGDILQKSNDQEIGKQKEIEKKQENELNY